MHTDLEHTNLKVKHPTLIKLKVLKRVEGQLEHIIMLPNDTQSDGDTKDKDILIGDEDIVPGDGEEP